MEEIMKLLGRSNSKEASAESRIVEDAIDEILKAASGAQVLATSNLKKGREALEKLDPVALALGYYAAALNNSLGVARLVNPSLADSLNHVGLAVAPEGFHLLDAVVDRVKTIHRTNLSEARYSERILERANEYMPKHSQNSEDK
jgi:hypothetical protein